VREIPRQATTPGITARYRHGSALLEVDSNYARVLDLLRIHWGDCAVPVSQAQHSGSHIRCLVRVGESPHLALVSLQGSRGADGAAIPPDSLKPLLAKRHSEAASPLPGWSLAFLPRAPRPFMTRAGYDALMDLSQEPLQPTPGFLHRYLLNAAVASQADMLFVHAASLDIGGAGTLFMGPAASGKTTVAFALAARGHAVLGDEMAGIHLASERLVPVRRTPGIRSGPRAAAVDERLAGRRWDDEVLQDGTPRTLARISELFPETAAAPAQLRCAFYLRRLGQRAAMEAVAPSARRGALLELISGDPMGVYATSPGRRMLKLLTLVQLLTARRCYLLDVGGPEETAALVEETVRNERGMVGSE
jgi:hypothetical protein